MKVLLVEDDAGFATIVAESLRRLHYTVELAEDGEIGWLFLESMQPDIAIVDVDLPHLDGISLCKRVRDRGITTPILLLTAREGDHDKVRGLDAGADDYLVKPCSLTELAARLRALLRRQGSGSTESILSWGDLSLDPVSCDVSYAGRPILLRPKEYSILELFLRNGQRVYSRAAILDHIWTLDDSPNESTIKAHIKGLRQHLREADAPPDIIESVYGLGYRLNMAFATSSQPDDDLWSLIQAEVVSQLQVIQAAVAAAGLGTLTSTLQADARQIAHKLAGSLGTAGRPEGTEAARVLEHFFQDKTAVVVEAEQALARLVAAVSPSTPVTTTTTIYVLGEADWLAELQQSCLASIEIVPIRELAPLLTVEPSPIQYQTIVLASDRNALAALPPPLPPFFVVSRESSLSETLAAKRAGAQGVLAPPLTCTQVVAAAQRSRRAQAPGDLRLLLVDDDPAFLTAIASMLTPWGFQPTMIENPLDAWDILASERPHGLLLDVDMPGVNGIELCEAIRNDDRYWDLPIWILTAHRDPETIQAVFEAGADDYIAKPVVAPELLARILNRLTRYARLRGASDKSQ